MWMCARHYYAWRAVSGVSRPTLSQCDCVHKIPSVAVLSSIWLLRASVPHDLTRSLQPGDIWRNVFSRKTPVHLTLKHLGYSSAITLPYMLVQMELASVGLSFFPRRVCAIHLLHALVG